MTEEKSEKKYLYSNWSRIDYPTQKPNEVTETKVYDDGTTSSLTTYEHKGQIRAGGYSGENITNAATGGYSSDNIKEKIVGGGYSPKNVTSANDPLAQSGYSAANISNSNQDPDSTKTNASKKKNDRDSLEYSS